jgi:SpoVK/Ycf46/Vps4 family AAA+-type ATPase
MNRLVNETEGLSGSDLKELCRAAAMAPVREFLRDHMNELANMKITVRRKFFKVQTSAHA